MGNRKKRPVQKQTALKITQFHLDIAVNVVAVVLLVAVLAGVQMTRAPVQVAYESMYKELETKGPDYALVLDFYLSCKATQLPRNLGSLGCLDQAESWAKNKSMTTPFRIIARDIREGEARAFMSTKS